MRKIRYAVATSLDGYIAGPNGEADWIIMDPDIDFEGIFAEFDTFLLGRRTFELMPQGTGQQMKTLVFSHTLRPEDHPNVTIVSDRAEETLEALRAEPGKDIWLFGGGELFRTLSNAGLVDTVELAIIPVLLGGGLPFLPPPARTMPLELTAHKVYPKTGIVSLAYAVNNGRATAKKHKGRRA